VQPLTADPVPAAAPADAPAPRAEDAAPPPERQCASCGAPMAGGQEWCLSCGASAPGSLTRPRWRSAAAIAGAAAVVLVLAAAAAGWAALSKGPRKADVVTTTVAAVATPAPATAPAVPGATGATTGTPLPTTPKAGTGIKAPAIPLHVATPTTIRTRPALKLPTKPPPAITTTPTTTTKPTQKTTTTESAGEGNSPEALVLDTNAASTYNPYALPVGNFGDPTLAIDGDTATGWTALVEPTTAPKMEVGLAIDLKSPERVHSAELVTTSPGMTIQLYGSAASTLPSAITDPTWVRLTHAMVVHKRHVRIKLLESQHAFRFIVLWISRAPANASGTTQSPPRLSVNELELFPPR
jgi:hypothetical protein